MNKYKFVSVQTNLRDIAKHINTINEELGVVVKDMGWVKFGILIIFLLTLTLIIMGAV